MGFAGVVMYGVYSELLKQGLLLFLPTATVKFNHAFFVPGFTAFGTVYEK